MVPDSVSGARLAHVGIAVRDIGEALAFYRDVLGLEPHPPQTADGATIVGLTLGDSAIELLHASDAASPIGKFLAKRGPGIHHICFRVPDLDAAIARCAAAGYRMIDAAPRPGADGRRVAFLHPTATAGILLELSD